ncbi:MAG: hypothetical protein K2N51_05100 [Lachnospiraceae bacterium]|nr:hypothetical protein [Lachnospiraceae bacterium]
MGLLNSIKSEVKKSGQNKGKFLYFREGQKVRIRFLEDMDDGLEIVWHDSFEQGINVPCQEIFGRECEYCDDDILRTRKQYCWSVWNYETKEVQLFMFAVNNCSPIPSLVAMYENYGTLMDRDYVISVQGKQQNKTFSVVPMDKVKFRNEKAKPYAKKTVLKMIDKAWPDENADNTDYDDEDEAPKKKKKTTAKSGKAKSKQTHNEEDDYEDDYDNEEFDDEEDEDKKDYSDMTAVELFKLCKERGIDAAKRKPEKYYIRLLEEDDEAHEDWDEEEDDDEWEDE